MQFTLATTISESDLADLQAELITNGRCSLCDDRGATPDADDPNADWAICPACEGVGLPAFTG